jgi:hypothetical protein
MEGGGQGWGEVEDYWHGSVALVGDVSGVHFPWKDIDLMHRSTSRAFASPGTIQYRNLVWVSKRIDVGLVEAEIIRRSIEVRYFRHSPDIIPLRCHIVFTDGHTLDEQYLLGL